MQLANPRTGTQKSPVTAIYKIVEKKGNYKVNLLHARFKKIQNNTDIIIIEANPQPVNGKIIIHW